MESKRRLIDLLLICLLLSLACAAKAQSRASFEVVSVKPAPPDADPNTGFWSIPGIGRFTASHVSLAVLIRLAYGIDESQIANKPGWLDSTLYDIDAKPEAGIALTRDQLKPRLQDLLQQRFHLSAQMETRPGRGYELVTTESVSRLTPTKGDHFADFHINVSRGNMRVANCTIAQLAQDLTHVAGFPVIDRTGITGSYDVSFAYNPKPEAESDLPALDVALKQATGLLLKPGKVPVEVLVINSVDKVPTPN
jgi:uncharacterized protein (TIGR03435 family)